MGFEGSFTNADMAPSTDATTWFVMTQATPNSSAIRFKRRMNLMRNMNTMPTVENTSKQVFNKE
jgi:hypothetical protein